MFSHSTYHRLHFTTEINQNTVNFQYLQWHYSLSLWSSLSLKSKLSSSSLSWFLYARVTFVLYLSWHLSVHFILFITQGQFLEPVLEQLHYSNSRTDWGAEVSDIQSMPITPCWSFTCYWWWYYWGWLEASFPFECLINCSHSVLLKAIFTRWQRLGIYPPFFAQNPVYINSLILTEWDPYKAQANLSNFSNNSFDT